VNLLETCEIGAIFLKHRKCFSLDEFLLGSFLAVCGFQQLARLADLRLNLLSGSFTEFCLPISQEADN
jgi:hypothetical protein